MKKQNPDFGTRLEVSVYGFEEHFFNAQNELLWFMDHLKKNFWIIEVDVADYLENI